MSSDLRNLVSDKMISYRTERLVLLCDKYYNLCWVFEAFLDRHYKSNAFEHLVNDCLHYIKEFSDKFASIDTSVKENAAKNKELISQYTEKLSQMIDTVEVEWNRLFKEATTDYNENTDKHLFFPFTSEANEFVFKRQYFKKRYWTELYQQNYFGIEKDQKNHPLDASLKIIPLPSI